VPKSILKQEIAIMSHPRSPIAANFSQIGKAILDLLKS
jgi:hypothetical protein